MYVLIRGGSWGYGPSLTSAIWVGCQSADLRTGSTGFRCLKMGTRPLVGLRGGSWLNFPRLARASTRLYYDPAHRSRFVGFRCVSVGKL